MPSQKSFGRFLTLAGLAYLLILFGLVTIQGSPLALAVAVILYLGVSLVRRPQRLRLRAARQVSADVVLQNTPVQVRLVVTNEGGDLEEVWIEDHLPPGLIVQDGDPSLMASLPGGSQLELTYTVTAPRGGFKLREVTVTAGDHLGVLRQQVSLAAEARLLFLPKIIPIRRVAIRPRRTHGHFGPIPSRQAGSGVDFYGLRDYQLGDPRHWINWRTSARHDQQLFVNQFEQERIADVGIILDARQQSNLVLDGTGSLETSSPLESPGALVSSNSLFEYSVRAAGSLSEALLADGNRVALLIYGFGVDRVFPGYGKVQQERILRALGEARTGHNFALESLGYLPTRFFPARSQVVMISPLLPGDLPAFTRLRALGYEVLLISPDPVDFERRRPAGDALSLEIARIERTLLLRKLQRLGVRILDWQVDRPLGPAVRETLSRVRPGRVPWS